MNKFKKAITAVLALAGAASVFCLTSCQESTPKISGYNILFADEFNGKSVNTNIWNKEIVAPYATNQELQKYTADDENSFIKDGKLVIRGMEYESGKYSSAKLTTLHNFDFTYGKVCVSAKVPEGKGLWPAIWMMPTAQSYGMWPKCGEIDIMEILGDNVSKSYGTLHYGNPHTQDQGTYTLTDSTFADSFHEFSVEWEPGEIRWYVDNNLILAVDNWFSSGSSAGYPAPFNVPFYLQLNLAIGGTWPGNPEVGADYMKQADFEVDYVRVYQKKSYDTNVTQPTIDLEKPDSTGNYIANGDFSTAEALNDYVDWHLYLTSSGKATATIHDNMVEIKPENVGTLEYSVQFLQYGISLKQYKKYKVSFDAWASENRTLTEVCMSSPKINYERYWSERGIKLTTTKQTFSYEFTVDTLSDIEARIEFNMGLNDSLATVYITNVRLEMI